MYYRNGTKNEENVSTKMCNDVQEDRKNCEIVLSDGLLTRKAITALD